MTSPTTNHGFLRGLPRLFLLLLGFLPVPSPAAETPVPAGECDVLVYGATPAGIMAAVTAARQGHRVILAEYEDHIGGIVSNGLTNADISKKQAVAGIYSEFRARIRDYYEQAHRRNPSAASEATLKLTGNGYRVEAHVAERIFHEMVDGEKERIQLRLRHELKGATVSGNRLVGVTLEDRGRLGSRLAYGARVFVDATYEGDLAAMAGVPYRTGREGRAEYGEPHAGRVYVRFGETELLPGSTGEGDGATEAYCFRLHLTNMPENRVPVAKPKHFNRDDYRHVLDQIRAGKITTFRHVVQLISVVQGKVQLNSDHPHPETGVPAESLDLAEENWEWPEATPARRRQIYERYLTHNVGLIWLLQNDPEVPAALRAEAGQYGWCRDEWPDNGHLPRQVYVRQGRRIVGGYTLTQRDGDVDAALGRTRVQPASIGIVEWSFDSHGLRKYEPEHPGVREGYIMIKHQPFQIPYGVVVPQKIDGLLVPVACSCSHVAYNALRMEPVFMALGEACGLAAHLALRGGREIREIPVGELQRLLVEQGGVITFYHDLKFDDPNFAAFQWLGARGLGGGYDATPGLELTRRDAAKRLARILGFEGRTWRAPAIDREGPASAEEVAQWLAGAGYAPRASSPASSRSGALTLAAFAQQVYATIAAR